MRRASALLLIVFALYIACESTDEQAGKAANINTLQLSLEDSIPLYNDSLSFSFCNLEKISTDTVLAYQYPILNLSLLNKEGVFKKEISRKGALKEQFLSAFINTRFGPDGNLYVLEEGNTPRLTIFDKDLQYLKNIPLTDKIGNHYIPTLKSSFHLEFPEQSPDSFLLHVSIGSILFHPSSKKLYLEDSSFAIIAIKNGEVKDVNFKVPLNRFEKVSNSLEADKKTWDSPIPVFKAADGLFYVKYEFDDLIYVFNKSWDLIKTYNVSFPYNTSGYSTSFAPMKDLNKSVESDFKFRYLNKYYYSMDIAGNKAFLLYYKPASARKVPRNVSEERNYNPVTILHVLDMSTRQEYSCELPVFISPYSQVVARNDQEIFLLGNNKLREDINIYKFRLGYEK